MPERHRPPPYRTVATVLVLAVFVVISLALCLRYGNAGEKMFSTAALTLFLLSLPQATTSAVQHLASGGGVKGAVAALMTDAKPETPK